MKGQYITPATKIDGRWFSEPRQRDPNEPRVYHPGEGRNAFLCVSTSGNLSLVYQNETSAWQSVSHDLAIFQSSSDLLTHAALGEDGDHILLATHDKARRLRLYKITIQWNISQQLRRDNFNILVVAPNLDVRTLTTQANILPQHSSPALLSHLRIVPSILGFADQGVPTVVTVLALFQHAPSFSEASHVAPEAFSVIARWHLESATPALQEGFTKMKPIGPVMVQPPVTVLRRQPDLLARQMVLTVQLQYHNTMLALGCANGAVEVRDRSTWERLETYGDTSTIASLVQSGFAYARNDMCADMATSVDGSAIIFANPDGMIDTKAMAFDWEPFDDGLTDKKAVVEHGIMCLARQYAILSCLLAANDETLSMLPHDLSQEWRSLFVKNVIHMLGKTTDVSTLDPQRQLQAVTKEYNTYRALSAQMILNTSTESGERSFAGQYAYAVLNLRLSWIALSQTLTRQNHESARPDLLPSLAGLISWALDLITYIADCLINATREAGPDLSAKALIETYVMKTQSPAIHLLLCSFPRALLRIHTPYIMNYLKIARQRSPLAKTVEERQHLIGAIEAAKSLPYTLRAFEDLVTSVDSRVRESFEASGTSAERRTEMELEMMTTGNIPDEFIPVVEALVNSALPKLCEITDMGKLYFWPTAWLGLANSMPSPGSKRYDIIKKVALVPDANVRTCRRCGAQMEDISSDRVRELPQWLQLAQKNCVCLSNWWTTT